MQPLRTLEADQHSTGALPTASTLRCAMEENEQKLIPIPASDWPKLRDIYLKNWPKHSFTYYTLNNYVEWSVKDPDMCSQDVHISSVGNNWQQHGTYLLEDHTKLSYTVQLDTCTAQHNELVMAVLRSLDPASSFTILYRENIRPVVEQRLLELNCKDFTRGYCPTTLYHLPREQCLKLEIRPVEGFEVHPLDLTNVARIDDLWKYKHPDSDYLISRVIKHNISLGAFDAETDTLCAWVLQSELGTIAFLQVEEAYQRRGLAALLVSRMCRLLAERGLDAIANISDTNNASMRLFQKLGFQPVDRVYWYDMQTTQPQKVAEEQFDQAAGSLKHG